MLVSRRTISVTGRGTRGPCRASYCPVVERQASWARVLEMERRARCTFSEYLPDYGKWASINKRGWVKTERYTAERRERGGHP